MYHQNNHCHLSWCRELVNFFDYYVPDKFDHFYSGFSNNIMSHFMNFFLLKLFSCPTILHHHSTLVLPSLPAYLIQCKADSFF